MKKGILLFDIDRTLFDTDKLLKFQFETISRILNIQDIKKFERFWESTLSGKRHITSIERIDLICSEFNIKNSEPLLNVYYGKEYKHIYKDSVYPEVVLVLNKLKSKFRFGIFSEGIEKYQKNKFASMGLIEFFDSQLIIIVSIQTKKEIVTKIPKGAIVVDDKLAICEFLTKNGVKAIWLNRKDSSVNPNFSTIHSLTELPEILSKKPDAESSSA